MNKPKSVVLIFLLIATGLLGAMTFAQDTDPDTFLNTNPLPATLTAPFGDNMDLLQVRQTADDTFGTFIGDTDVQVHQWDSETGEWVYVSDIIIAYTESNYFPKLVEDILSGAVTATQTEDGFISLDSGEHVLAPHLTDTPAEYEEMSALSQVITNESQTITIFTTHPYVSDIQVINDAYTSFINDVLGVNYTTELLHNYFTTTFIDGLTAKYPILLDYDLVVTLHDGLPMDRNNGNNEVLGPGMELQNFPYQFYPDSSEAIGATYALQDGRIHIDVYFQNVDEHPASLKLLMQTQIDLALAAASDAQNYPITSDEDLQDLIIQKMDESNAIEWRYADESYPFFTTTQSDVDDFIEHAFSDQE